MFEPQLEPNRTEFNDLNRRKWRTFVLSLASAIPMAVLAMIYPDYAWFMAIVLLVIMNATSASSANFQSVRNTHRCRESLSTND